MLTFHPLKVADVHPEGSDALCISFEVPESLRDAYRARSGASYSPRDFHTELLSYGGLPVSLARWGMGLDE